MREIHFSDYYRLLQPEPLRLAHDRKVFLPIATVGLDLFLRASPDFYVSSVKRKQKYSYIVVSVFMKQSLLEVKTFLLLFRLALAILWAGKKSIEMK